MKWLFRAVLRSFLEVPGRLLALFVLSALFVAIAAGTSLGLNRIEDTTDRIYAEQKLFDLDVRIKPTAQELVPAAQDIVRAVPGLAAGAWRLAAAGSVELPDGRVAQGTLYAVAPEVRPAVCDVRMLHGEFLAKGHEGGVIIDKTFADDLALHLGDSLRVRVASRELSVHIRGIAVFPEHLLSSLGDDFYMPVRKAHVVLLFSQELVEKTLEYPTVNSFVATLSDGAARDQIRDRLREHLTAQGATPLSVLLREDQHSVARNRARLTVFRDFLPLVVIIFEGVALFVLILVVRRIFYTVRKELATLIALGISARAIAAAWIGVVYLSTLLANLVGTTGAFVLSHVISRAYMQGTGFPILLSRTSWQPLPAVWGASFLLVGGAILAVVLHTLLQAPATTLRDAPAGFLQSRLLLRLSAFLSPSRGGQRRNLYPELIGVRNVLRRPLLFLGSSTCIAAMLAAGLAMYIFADSQGLGLKEFMAGQRWDYFVQLDTPRGAAQIDRLVREVGGTTWEGVQLQPAEIEANGRKQAQALVATPLPSLLRPGGGVIFGRWLRDGNERTAVITLRLAQALDLHPDDEITVQAFGRTTRLRVCGIMNNYVMNQVLISEPLFFALRDSPQQGAALPAVVISAPPSALPLLARRGEVSRVLPRAMLVEAGERGNRLMAQVMRAYAHIAAVVAFMLIVLIVRFNITDRQAEYALLRTLGISPRETFRSLIVEAALSALCVLLFSLPLCRLFLNLFQQRIMKVLNFVHLTQSPRAFVLLLAPALAVMVLTMLFDIRRIARIPAAQVLRRRDG